MNEKFIYVFSREDCDKLTSAGYQLMKSDDKGGIYVFLNKKEDANFDINPIEGVDDVVFSSTLAF